MAVPEKINIATSRHRTHLDDALEDGLREQFRGATVEFVPMGSSLKFCALAEGSIHLYPRKTPTWEWDTAAAQAIVKESGGIIIDSETGREPLYNRENMLNTSFTAYSKEILSLFPLVC